MELGPKGTGKSHIFSELSPHGILISGGEVTQAKLFINNSNNQIGLVGYWDVVAFDEFAGSQKTSDKNLVDIMKNYMANKSFSRGKDVFGATASFAFVGNTEHSVPYMLKNTNLFDALPKAYYDTAFLDRAISSEKIEKHDVKSKPDLAKKELGQTIIRENQSNITYYKW